MGGSQSKLSPDHVSDLEKNTHFTQRELQKWHKDFLKDCPSGRLDEAALIKVYTKFLPRGEPSEFASYMFNGFDVDGDGTIDFNEFVLTMSVILRGQPDEKLKLAFQLYDINRDGTITRNEILRIGQAINKMTAKPPLGEVTPEQWVDNLFSKLDRDQDDKLTLEEFAGGTKDDPIIKQCSQVWGCP